MFRRALGIFLIAGMMAVPGTAFSHCEIPCGIFDDELKFKELDQHVDTIEKSIREIAALEAAAKPEMNQLVRWIRNKDEHADKIKEEVADYFLSQRVKFPEGPEGKGFYDQQLELLHRITVYAMRTKQTLDPENVVLLRRSISDYRELYRGIHGHPHDEGPDLPVMR